MDTRIPKPYSAVMDEWLAWNANAGDKAPKFASVDQYAKFMDGREGTSVRQSAYDPNVLQKANDFIERQVLKVPFTEGMFGAGTGPVTLGDIGGGYGAVVGEQAEKVGLGTEAQWAEAGRGIPRAGLDVAMLAAPGGIAAKLGMEAAPLAARMAGWGAGLADTALAAYAPQKDVVAGVAAPLSLGATAAVMPVVSRVAGETVARAFMPTAKEIGQMPTQAAGRAITGLTQEVEKVATPVVQNAIRSAQIGAEGAVGTGIGEVQRVGTEAVNILSGRDDRSLSDIQVFDPASLAMNVAGSLAFAPVDVAQNVRQGGAVGVVKTTGQKVRVEAHQEQMRQLKEQFVDRPKRMAELNGQMVEAVRTGQDTSGLMTEMRAIRQAAGEWTARVFGDETEAKVLKSHMGLLDEDIKTINERVFGMFDRLSAQDPTVPGGEAVRQLISKGELPQTTAKRAFELVDQADAQGLGESELTVQTFANLVFRDLVDKVPAAREAWAKRAMAETEPSVFESRTLMQAREEEALMERFYQTALPMSFEVGRGRMVPVEEYMLQYLTPEQKAAFQAGVDGRSMLPLDVALAARVRYMSDLTASGKLQAEYKAAETFDQFMRQFSQFMETYDSATGLGMWPEVVKDEVVTRPVMLEDIVAGETLADGGIRFKIRPQDVVTRRGDAPLASRMLEFRDDIFGGKDTAENIPEDDREAMFKRQKGQIEGLEKLTDLEKQGDKETKVTTDEETPTSQELEPTYTAGEESSTRVTRDSFDASIALAAKIEEFEGRQGEFYEKFGGRKVFGGAAGYYGKGELFYKYVKAMIAKQMLDIGTAKGAHMTELPREIREFYEAWREVMNVNLTKAPKPSLDQMKSWGEITNAVTQALYSYFPQKMGVTFEDIVKDILSQTSWRKDGQIVERSKYVIDPTPENQAVVAKKAGFKEGDFSPAEWAVKQRQPFEVYSEKGKAEYEKQGLTVRPADMLFSKSGSSLDPVKGRIEGAGTGDPVMDAVVLARNEFGRMGMPPEEVEMATKVFVRLVGMHPETVMVGKLETTEPGLLGGAVTKGRGRGTIGIAVDKAEMEKNVRTAVDRVLMVFAHEGTHLTGLPGSGPSAWTVMRLQRKAELEATFGRLGKEATKELLGQYLPEVFFPEGYRPETKVSLEAGPARWETEAVSRLMEYVALGAATRKGGTPDVSTVLWLPSEVQKFLKFGYRDLANMSSVMEGYFAAKGEKRLAGVWREIATTSEAYLSTTVKKMEMMDTLAETMMARLTAMGSVDVNSPNVKWIPGVVDGKALAELSRENGVEFSKVEPEQLTIAFGPDAEVTPMRLGHEVRAGTTIPAWSRWMGQTFQMFKKYQRARIHLAEQAGHLMNDLEPAYWRLIRELHKPFMTLDKNGDAVYDPTHPVQQVLKGKMPKATEALRELTLWANETKTPLTEVKGGVTSVHPDAEKKMTQVIGKFSPAEQQAVIETLGALRKGYTTAAGMLYQSAFDGLVRKAARIMMTKDKGLFWEEAKRQAQAAVTGSVRLEQARLEVETAQEAVKRLTETGLVPDERLPQAQAALQGAIQRLSQEQAAYGTVTKGLTTEQLEMVRGWVEGPMGAGRALVEMKRTLDSRGEYFFSEQRSGRYMVFAKTRDGETYTTGFRTKQQAEKHRAELVKEGYTDIGVEDTQHRDNRRKYEAPDEVVGKFIEVERNAYADWTNRMREVLSAEDYAVVSGLAEAYTPGLASEKMLQQKSVRKFMMEQKQTPGRERLDPLEVFADYTRRLVGSSARRTLQGDLDLLLNDPRVRAQGEFRRSTEEAAKALLEPIGDDYVTIRTAVTASFLGLPNVVSPMVESTQMLTTILPELVREAGSYKAAVGGFTKAFKHVNDAYRWATGNKMAVAQLMKRDPRTFTAEETRQWAYRRARDEGRFQHGVAQQDMVAKDWGLLSIGQSSKALGEGGPRTAGELAKDTIYNLARVAMVPYSKLSGYNNQVAFMAGLDMYYAQGFRGDELYQKANMFKDRATFGGGKPNEVGFVNKMSNETTRSTFALMNTLQRYAFGSTTQIKDYVDDMIGRSGVSGLERVHATKALVASLAAQAMFAGAMGMPGAMIVAGVLRTQYDVDLKQAAREAWYKLFQALGSEDATAVMLANVAQNGVMGQALGVDLSSRFTINSYMGFDAYEGFDAWNMMGPVGGVVERLLKATKYVAKGDMVKAAGQAVPPSMTPMVDMFGQKVGDSEVGLRDASGKLLMGLTPREKVMYGMGVRPYRYRQYRDMQEAKRVADKAFGDVRSTEIDEAADSLLKGDSSAAWDWARRAVQLNPTVDSREAMRSVIDRALVQTNAQDLLSTALKGNEERTRAIAESFGNVNQRRSEVDLLRQREELNAVTGFGAGKPATAREYTRAAMIDMLVESRGVTRPEAVRMVQALGY